MTPHTAHVYDKMFSTDLWTLVFWLRVWSSEYSPLYASTGAPQQLIVTYFNKTFWLDFSLENELTTSLKFSTRIYRSFSKTVIFLNLILSDNHQICVCLASIDTVFQNWHEKFLTFFNFKNFFYGESVCTIVYFSKLRYHVISVHQSMFNCWACSFRTDCQGRPL